MLVRITRRAATARQTDASGIVWMIVTGPPSSAPLPPAPSHIVSESLSIYQRRMDVKSRHARVDMHGLGTQSRLRRRHTRRVWSVEPTVLTLVLLCGCVCARTTATLGMERMRPCLRRYASASSASFPGTKSESATPCSPRVHVFPPALFVIHSPHLAPPLPSPVLQIPPTAIRAQRSNTPARTAAPHHSPLPPAGGSASAPCGAAYLSSRAHQHHCASPT